MSCSFNSHITNAVATTIHFAVDCICSFITVEFVTELTKFLAGRLRPNFLQVGMPFHACTLHCSD